MLDAAAATLDSQGKSGNELRNYYQTTLGLTTAETALLKSNGVSCLNAVQQIEQQAQTIIGEIRAQYPNGLGPSLHAPPPPDPRLQQLTQQRDNATNAQIQVLQSVLTAKTFLTLDTYIKTRFAKQVSSTPIVLRPPTNGTPARGGSR